ncbi:MAG: endonuclease/exonuclease/phosphatase family protein, partial [Candidatus Thorarchaeota archaeon]
FFIIFFLLFSFTGLLFVDNFYAEDNVSIGTTDRVIHSLRIITYNIHQYWSNEEAKLISNKLLTLFQSINPDIIGLQETWDSYSTNETFNVKWFASKLNMSYLQFSGIETSYLHGLGLLSKYPFINKNYLIIKDSETVFTRTLIWGQIMTPIGNITVFNTHLDTFPSQANQINQTHTIYNVTKNYSNVILIGDLNIPDSIFFEPYRFITEKYEDTWIASGHKTYEGRTWPSDSPLLRVDYILVQDKSWMVVKNTTRTIGDASYSDHLGITTEITI